MLDLAWRPRAQLDRESIAIYLGLERGMPQPALDAIKGIDAALETVRTYGVPHHASAPIHRHLQPD